MLNILKETGMKMMPVKFTDRILISKKGRCNKI